MSERRLHAFLVVFLLCCAPVLTARVVSYAPYSDRAAFVGTQHRLNRHFAVVEGPNPAYYGPMLSPSPYWNGNAYGQVVVYDFQGQEEPRVVFPQDGSLAAFSVLAVRENAQHIPTLLVQTNSTLSGKNPQQQWIMLISSDGGTTWKHVLFPSDTVWQLMNSAPDLGGPCAHGRYSGVRIGTEQVPFIVATSTAVYAITPDGVSRVISPTTYNPYTIGTNRDGSLVLVRVNAATIAVLPVNPLAPGQMPTIHATITVDAGSYYEGWIGSDETVYLEALKAYRSLQVFRNGVLTDVAAADGTGNDQFSFFAVPAFDYDGAWMIQRGVGKPTKLLHYTPAGGLKEEWQDVTGPEVEALHAGASGNSLLIQVHRSRPQADQRLFKDPALAVWHIGEPAPTFYDELYLNETATKGFVHVDVDKIAAGEPFVFDSGPPGGSGSIRVSPAPAGGSDVTQEWGVVRASLKQRLVLPGIGRIQGAYGSFWYSDVILYNPMPTPQNVLVRYVPTGSGPVTDELREKTLTLAPAEIRVITDALKSIFGYESGNGAFFLEPEEGINATSRTYTRSTAGSFGFGMNAIDVFAATRPRFPVTFAGAFGGTNFRTNLVLTDVSGRGTIASTIATGANGVMGAADVSFSTVANGQQQIASIQMPLALLPSDTGALLVRPTAGEAIASLYLIDNRTNDSTWFPPDLPAPTVRTIPVIGHVDGANNSQFRSDLYLYNPAEEARSVTLQVQKWDAVDPAVTMTLTLLPHEARVIKDVLYNAFGKTGIARLRYLSTTDSSSVRVTSRTYNVDANGGTFGFLMPPLNNFQTAGPGDTLEILGAVGDKNFRTNLGIVELTGFPDTKTVTVRVEIIDNAGHTIDTFTASLAVAGGMQIDDIFHKRNLGDGPPAALIRVTPITGMIGAWATIIDNGTNDATYLAAQLGAK